MTLTFTDIIFGYTLTITDYQFRMAIVTLVILVDKLGNCGKTHAFGWFELREGGEVLVILQNWRLNLSRGSPDR